MSILFDDASSQYASIASVPSLSFPFAVACWLYTDDLETDQILAAFNDASSEDNYYSLEIFGKHAEVTEITTVADRSGSDSLDSEHFLIDSPNDLYYVWFSIDSGSIDPAPSGRTGIEVPINQDDSADAVATALQAVLDAEADFGAAVNSNVVTVTNADIGDVTDAVDFDTSFAFNVIQQGTDNAILRGKLVDNSSVVEQADSSNYLVQDTWHHALVIFNSATDVRLYLDDVESLSPGGTAVTPTGVDTLSIGRLSKATPTQYMSGRIAEVTSWDLTTVFTAAERNDLATDKQSALLVRSDELTYHAPMYDASNPIIDIVGRRNAAPVSAPVVADHPPIQQFEPEVFQRFRAGPIEFTRDVLSAIGFTQQANWELTRYVSSSLSFNQATAHNVRFVDVQSNLELEDEVTKQGTLNVSIEHSLSLTQLYGPTEEETASNDISFTQEAARAGDPSSDILFEGVVAPEKSTGVSNDVSFSQDASAQQEVTKPLSSDIQFGQVVSAYTIRNCDEHEYSPGGGMPSINFGVRDDIILSYSGGSITLRNPDFGNTESVDVDRVLNISRGGTPNFMRDPQWTKSTTHSISIAAMTRVKAQELLTFLQGSLGLLVTYTDYEDQDWDGIITNPDAAVVDEGDCRFSVNLTIESTRA